jgi:hypothetical protein
MATTDIKMETVPKELYDDLLDKYNKLTEKYAKLMELYQTELDINVLATQPIKQADTTITYNPLNTSTTKVTKEGGIIQTEWKEGFHHDFNMWQ